MSTRSAPDTELEQAGHELLLAIAQLIRRVRADVNDGDLSLSQASALGHVERAGRATTADLARADSVRPQSMGATLAELERLGLVRREPHPTDGRQVLFSLTGEGITTRRKRSLAKRAWLLAALEQLKPADRRTLNASVELLKRLGEG